MRALEITDTSKIDQAISLYKALGETAFLEKFGIQRGARSIFIRKPGDIAAPLETIIYAAYALQFPDRPALSPYDLKPKNVDIHRHIESLGYIVGVGQESVSTDRVGSSLLRQHFANRTPRIWGKGYWGFSPEDWGCVTFTQSGARDSFATKAKDGDLVMIYATDSTEVEMHERRRVLGFYEIRNEPRDTRDCISDNRWHEKQIQKKDQWNYAIPAIKAWRTLPVNNALPKMADIAQDTYTNKNFTLMATRPVRLSKDDENRALDLLVAKTSVFGEPFNPPHQFGDTPTDSVDLKPSRGVPPYSGPRGWTEESGPKKLYRMRLICDVSVFLGESGVDIGNQRIYKIGYSARPESRCKHFNNHLPFSKAVRWELEDMSAIFSDEQSALDAETALKHTLANRCRSLGREFFLADPEVILACWDEVLNNSLQ